MKVFRAVLAIVAIVAVAVRGIFSFLNWFESQIEPEATWADEEELEEAF